MEGVARPVQPGERELASQLYTISSHPRTFSHAGAFPTLAPQQAGVQGFRGQN